MPAAGVEPVEDVMFKGSITCRSKSRYKSRLYYIIYVIFEY